MSDEESNGNRAENGISDLTTEQQDLVRHLQEIGGAIDHETALSIIQECSWDLELAVNKLFGISEISREGPRLRRSNDIGTDTQAPSVDLVPPNQRVLRIADSQPRGWWWAFWMLLEPLRLPFDLLMGVARFIGSLLWPDPRNQVTDPVGDVRRFISYFKKTYATSPEKPIHPDGQSSSDLPPTPLCPFPPFYEGSYAQALQEAKRSLRFLVVYLHGDSHEDTRDFCENTLQNDDVLRCLNDSRQIVFWGCNIKSPEGYRVSRTLREHTYPFIGVIGLTNLSTNESGRYSPSSIGMALLGRIEGAIKPTDLIQQLTSILNDHQGATIAARLDRSEREAAAQIREEQDLAYRKALEEDRAKSAAREAESRHAAMEAAEQLKLEKHAERLKRARRTRQSRWHTCLPPAPAAGTPSTVQLSVRMPNGQRFSRVFFFADSAKILYYFVLSLDNAPEHFEIQANFPKRLLPCQPEEQSDLEEYFDSDDSLCSSEIDTTPDQPAQSHKKRKTSLDVVVDWSPKLASDPPSLQQLGLDKAELLFIIDKDA